MCVYINEQTCFIYHVSDDIIEFFYELCFNRFIPNTLPSVLTSHIFQFLVRGDCRRTHVVFRCSIFLTNMLIISRYVFKYLNGYRTVAIFFILTRGAHVIDKNSL